MTTTLFTLLRQPTPELQILSWSCQLKPIRFNEYTALRFLSNALRAMRNAQAPDCAPIDQLSTAYDGIYSLCLGSLYLHGLLPSGKEGYRALAIQLGSECLQLSPVDRDKILNANLYLQLMVSDCPEYVEEVVAQNILALGQHTLKQAQKVFPDWFH
jgi:hypothetical protein